MGETNENDQTEKLIMAVQFNKIIYEKKEKGHKNAVLVLKAWEQVSRATGLPGENH